MILFVSEIRGHLEEIRGPYLILLLILELKWYGTFFDELCVIMIGFDRGQRVG